MMTDEERNGIAGAITANRDEAFLKKMFSAFGIADDYEEKKHILLQAMGNPKIGFLGEPTEEERYLTILRIFLSGEWQD